MYLSLNFNTKIKHEGAGGKVTETNFVYDPINQLLN
ncbi:type IV secretion protein Rhs, partial [Bacillus thuringiensis]